MFNLLYEVVIFLLDFLKPLLPKFANIQQQAFFLHNQFYSTFQVPLLLSVLSGILVAETAYRTFRFAVFVVKLIRG